MSTDPESGDASREQALVAYLAEVLPLDPGSQVRRVLELRAAHRARFGALDSGPRCEASGDVGALRARAEEVVRCVREQFWELEPGDVPARLDELSCESLPDLARAMDRLLEADEARGAVDKLSEDPRAEKQLVRVLRQILAADEPRAAVLRERTVRTGGLGIGVRRSRAFVRLVREEYPGVAALEEDWFSQLGELGRQSSAPSSFSTPVGCIATYFVLALVWRIIRSLVAYLQEL